MRHIVMDQKSNEPPHPAAAIVQTDNPTPISLKGLWLQAQVCITYKNLNTKRVKNKIQIHLIIAILIKALSS